MSEEKRKVRVRKFPGEAIEVTESEYLDLKRQGLLVSPGPRSSSTTQKSEASGDKKEGK